MNTIKTLYRKISIRRKILIIILGLSIVPIVTFGFSSYNIYRSAIIQRTIQQAEDNNRLVIKQLSNIISDAESAATILTININNVYVQEDASPDRNNIRLYNLISNELDYAKLVFPFIDDIAFVDTQNTVHFTDQHKNYDHVNLYGSELITTLHDNSGRNQWFPMAERGYLVTSEEPVATLGKKIWDMRSGQTLGFLVINIKQATFESVFNNQLMTYDLVSDNNDIKEAFPGEIASHVMNFMESDKDTSAIVGDYLLTKNKIDTLNWTLISHEEIHTFLDDLNTILTTVLLSIALIIIIEIFFGQYLSRLITVPIMKLKEGVEKVSTGDFNVQVNVKTQDEIGLFVESFNDMSKQINTLIKEVEVEAETKRSYELALMHQQIKPHFLYNTLDIIIKLSEMNKPKASQRAAKKLAHYYQKSLSSGADIITLEEELSLTKDYIDLQQIRYKDLFDYLIDVPEKMLKRRIPKLTLQPLVENAIYHGFKYNKDEKGLLKIYCQTDDFFLNLIIEDNGNGMTKEKLNEMMIQQSDFSNEHFGLFNVKDRIKLTFGKMYGLSIESMEQVGTKVIIHIPLEET